MKKRDKNKRAMSQLKAFFLIANITFAVVAFSWMGQANNNLYKLNSSDKKERFKYPEIYD